MDHDINTVRSEVEKATITDRGEIIIGHSISFNYRYAGTISTVFASIWENHVIQFEKKPREELMLHLLKRDVHCVLAESGLIDEKHQQDIRFYSIISLPFYAIMRNGHPLSANEELATVDLKGQEIYATSLISTRTLNELHEQAGSLFLIEETDRNTLFNRIIKNAVEINPADFEYYACVPLNIPKLEIGLYTLRRQPDVVKDVIKYVQEYTVTYSSSNSIL